MSFSKGQVQELGQPLDKSVIKSRKQGTANVDYIDGYHAISEANRIFGFDGWSYKVINLTKVQDEERTTQSKEGPKTNWNAGYVATVELTAGGVTRMDVGAGNGIDKNPFQAHESAVKEAVTDALKRCLRSFGNTFGLALYDRDRKKVGKRQDAVQQAADEISDAQDRVRRANTYYGLLQWQGQEKKENTEKIKLLAKTNGTDWLDELELACKDLGLL